MNWTSDLGSDVFCGRPIWHRTSGWDVWSEIRCLRRPIADQMSKLRCPIWDKKVWKMREKIRLSFDKPKTGLKQCKNLQARWRCRWLSECAPSRLLMHLPHRGYRASLLVPFAAATFQAQPQYFASHCYPPFYLSPRVLWWSTANLTWHVCTHINTTHVNTMCLSHLTCHTIYARCA